MLFYLDIKNLLQGCIYQRVIKYGKSYIKLILQLIYVIC